MKNTNIIIAIFILNYFVGYSQKIVPQNEVSIIKTEEKKDFKYFGRVLDISNDYIVTSPARFSNIDDISKSINGSVYIYKQNMDEWILDTIIRNNDRNMFGSSVSIHDDYVVIGAPTDNIKGKYSGSIYIYRNINSKWVQEEVFVGSNVKEGDKFGYYITMVDDLIVVGSASNSDVYLYKNHDGSWKEVGIVNNTNQKDQSSFVSSMTTNGNYIFVGYEQQMLNSIELAGIVYVYKFIEDKIVFVQKITSPKPTELGYFGTHISVSESNLFISEKQTSSESYTIYTYSFQKGKWLNDGDIKSIKPQRNDGFGCIFDVDNDILVVSAIYNNNPNEDQGIVFVYKKNANTWENTNVLLGTNTIAYDRFGWSISIDENKVLVGTFRNSLTKKESMSQSIYLYSIE